MQGVVAKKSLGQHFLIDKNIAGKIVESLFPDSCHSLIEIGPGTGILTQFLLKKDTPDFLAVELDRESYNYLLTRFPDHQDQFILGDFLQYPLEQHKAPLSLIGNLPYFISSPVFFRVIEHRSMIHQAVFMIQKEVAERITAPPGNKTYGILSVLLQAYFDIKYLFTVNASCFSPPPKVKSAVIRLTRNSREEMDCRPDLFQKIVKATFNQRRKVIRNSLKGIFLNLPEDNELLTKRPEQLTVEQFVELTKHIELLNPGKT